MPAALTGGRMGAESAARNNESTIRSLYRAFNRRDIDGLLEHLSPDVRWYTFDLALQPDVYRGHAEVGRFLRQVLGDSGEFRAHPERVVAERDMVMATVRFAGRRARGLPESSYRVVHVWTLQDGVATRHRLCLDPGKAKRVFARRCAGV